MIHLIKLSVGVRDIAHLEALQAARLAVDPLLRHHTRNSPKRAEELCAGGSIYWVIGGVVLVRQRLLDIIEDHWDDGTRCAGLVLDPTLVRVQARAMKAFQGWRYLQPADAPADITASGGTSGDEIPDELRRALAALALI
ncbi:DUF1489 family protein [Acidocella sp.]|uniref:DUF1489 family protein n=1 Tax=Acidocella sp. TaxID=50710 RepID=UPI002F4058BF